MKDVRNIAEEKVRQRLDAAGQNSGFASERARAKQAVADELNEVLISFGEMQVV